MLGKAILQKPVVLFILAALSLFFCDAAFASNVMSTIANDYKVESLKWFQRLQGVANSLFWKLAFLEFIWSAINWLLKEREAESFMASLLKKIMSIGFFYTLLLNAGQWIPAIINSFIKAAGIASSVTALDPSKVLDTGINTAVSLIKGFEKSSLLGGDLGPVLIAVVSAFFILLAFVFIACHMMVALIESYIITGTGVLFLGFGGSRWTTEYAQKYIAYAFSIGVKLFTMYIIIGVGISFAAKWGIALTGPAGTDLNVVFSVLAGSIVFAALAFLIPKIASSMLSGAPNLTAGNVVGTSAAIAVSTVAVAALAAKGAAAAFSAISKSVQGLLSGASKAGSASAGGSISGFSGAGGSGSGGSSAPRIKAPNHPAISSNGTSLAPQSGPSHPAPSSGPSQSGPNGSSTNPTSTATQLNDETAAAWKSAFQRSNAPQPKKGAQSLEKNTSSETSRSAKPRNRIMPPFIPHDDAPANVPDIKLNHTT